MRLALADELSAHPAVRVAQVVKQVRELALDAFRDKRRVRHAVLVHALEDVVEHVAAHLVEQVVFRLEVRVERRAPHVGTLDDLRHRHRAVVSVAHERLKGVVDGLARFALPPVELLSGHGETLLNRTFRRNRFVAGNGPRAFRIAHWDPFASGSTELLGLYRT